MKVYSFSINGDLMHSEPEISRTLISPTIARDGHFNNYLIYIKDTLRTLSIRKLPSLELYDLALTKPGTVIGVSESQCLGLIGCEDGSVGVVGNSRNTESAPRNSHANL